MRKHVDFFTLNSLCLEKKSFFGLKGNFDGIFVDLQGPHTIKRLNKCACSKLSEFLQI